MQNRNLDADNIDLIKANDYLQKFRSIRNKIEESEIKLKELQASIQDDLNILDDLRTEQKEWSDKIVNEKGSEYYKKIIDNL